MIWRLFATVLAVSDTGSIALNSVHSDWPSERSCISATETIYSAAKPTQSFGGHNVTIKISAACLPVTP
jgi:hypothetical protein